MAITSVDGAIAGMKPPQWFAKVVTPTLVAGRPHSLFYLAGIPGAGTAPAPGVGGATLTSATGQIPFPSGTNYLARFVASATQAGQLLLCDRLWNNSGLTITTTSEQAFTSAVQIPARDMDGSTAGRGVYMAVEVSGATGNNTPTLTLKYTNTLGTSSQSATNIIATVATSAVGSFYPIALQAGDEGVGKPQSLTLSTSWSSGTIHVVCYRVIASLDINFAGTANAIDALKSGFPNMSASTVPFLVFIPNTTTASVVQGQLVYTQG